MADAFKDIEREYNSFVTKLPENLKMKNNRAIAESIDRIVRLLKEGERSNLQ